MIIHPDTPNRKPIEQKVRELILKKLYVKVDDELLFIDKEDFIGLILTDVIAIAKADFDMDDALKIALKEEENYQSMPEVKRNQLEETLSDFDVEIDAYRVYLDGLEEGLSEEDMFLDVLLVLNSETELLVKRLHQLMVKSLARKFAEQEAKSLGVDRWGLLDVFANQVKLIASYKTMDEAVEEAFWEYEDSLDEGSLNEDLINREWIKGEFERFSPLAKDEISVYRIAVSLQEQDAEIPMILGTVRQMLQLGD